jgi:hypothetical protein
MQLLGQNINLNPPLWIKAIGCRFLDGGYMEWLLCFVPWVWDE